MLGSMCGRYAASAGAQEVVEAFDVAADLTDGALRPTWNAAPTQRRAVVLTRSPGEGEPPRRELRLLTWGLVPSWSKDAAGGARMINARAETLLERPAFRRAAASRRCLVPADGWYEWQASPQGPRGRKQPHFMALADGGPLALAGIYEFWRARPAQGGPADAAADPEEDDPWLVTFAVLTRDAEPGLRAVHDRMPLVLPPQAFEDWLDPAVTAAEAVAAQVDAARSLPPGRFTAVPVSSRVGQVREDDAALRDPVGPALAL